jgi:hypothetical protein
MNSMSRVLSSLLMPLIFLSGFASLAVPAVAGISVRMVYSPQAARTLSFDYDWRIRTHLDYDGYDGSAVHATNENLDQSTGDRAYFVNSVKILAAKTVATPYGPAVQSMTADAQAALREARAEANAANRALHQADPFLNGLQLHEIQPVKFGGSPTDPLNKIPLTLQQHSPATTWWNQLQRSIKP